MNEISLKLTVNLKERKTYMAKEKVMNLYVAGKEIIVLIESHLFFVGKIIGMTFFAPSKETIEMDIKPSGTVITDKDFPKNISKSELIIYEPLTMSYIVITSKYEMMVE